MIYLVHEDNKVVSVLDSKKSPIIINYEKSISNTLFQLAKDYPSELIIWSHNKLFGFINVQRLSKIFHHKCILASYSLNDDSFIPNEIGYVDQSIFIKVNKEVTFPTWLMSSDVGGINAELLNTIFTKVKRDQSFSYFINSIAKMAMSQGLFCYSEPNLLVKTNIPPFKINSSTFKLFQFVKQHYKLGWVFFLFLCFVLFERKFPLFQLLISFRYRRKKTDFDFSNLQLMSSRKLVNNKDVDVIIPTIGRKKYLYNVLRDLSSQTVLPKNVIVIEQNEHTNSVSELDYIYKEQWPFNVKHKFIHRTGVCNARNLAIKQVTSDWTFFGDDDIHFENDLIEKSLNSIQKFGSKTINTVCLQPKEVQTYNKTSQSTIFGSGTSFVSSELLSKIKFDPSFEFNYGEDSDFGMQIRNLGEDVIFISNILITHLKAPIGGYRIKHKNQWDDEKFIPKPSPTIMLFNRKYFTEEQMLGYKLLLFIKFYKGQSIKNPFRYISHMKRRWNSSLYWSKILADNKDA